MPDHLSLSFVNKLTLCAERGLKSTDQRFSEAAVTPDSLITVKSHSLTTSAPTRSGAVPNASSGISRLKVH